MSDLVRATAAKTAGQEVAAGVSAIAIGRNEGARLKACLASLAGTVERIVYVDSGSTDGSPEAARAAGAEVVALDLSLPFTAARARNAGLARLRETGTRPVLVQFVDGDCMLQPGWIATARAFLERNPKVGAVCGRRRERFPGASVYNRLCDREWDTPVGRAKACGGDAMMRMAALDEVGGFRDDLIAGEEPELCVRLRAAGWDIWRLDAEMTLHDAAMVRVSQWWRRARRAGHAYATGAMIHGRPPERHWVSETRRALLWGAALPVAALAGAVVVSPWALLLFAAYPLQAARLAAREGITDREAWEWAVFTVLGKLAEAQGVVGALLDRALARQRGLIEYK
jgi:GT2 family glycosyltransferase